MRKLQVYSVAFVAALGLAACGDDDSDFSALPEKQPDNAVLSIDDLSNCTSKKEGNLEFVKDTPYVCAESDGKYKWIQVSQTEDEPEDFKVCNQKREGQYALASKEDILYACSDEEWIPVESGDVSSSSGKEANSSSSKPKSSDSGKDVESSSSVSSSGGKSSSSGPSTSSGTFEQSSSSSVSSSSAASSSGTSSSEVRSSSSIPSSFSVGDDRSVYDAQNNTLTDYRDGQVYRTVSIGTQTWMAQNLNFAYLVATETLDSTSFCYNNSSPCPRKGRLYTWAAAMDSAALFSDDGKGCGYVKACSPTYPVRGACPKDWHLPTIYEWETLFSQVGDEWDVSRLLKSTDYWYGDYTGTDAYGFSVIPAGTYSIYTRYRGGVDEACFWTSIQSLYNSDDEAEYVMFYNAEGVMLSEFRKENAYSVRCIKDVPPSSSSATPESSSSRRRVIESSSAVHQDVVDPSTVVTGTMTDERDGQTYGTVTIGEQTWMAQNLRFAYMVGTNPRDSSSLCYKNGLDRSCSKYGRYYTWASAMDSAGVWSTDGKGCGIKELCTPSVPVQGICPSGWHLPSNYEWRVLLWAVNLAGISLCGGDWNRNSCMNTYQFWALPGGYKREGENLIGDFVEGGSYAYFWTSAGFYVAISSGNTALLYESSGDEDRWYNVRCIKD